MKILLVHQSAELYGSDRSFLSICKMLGRRDLEVDVLLPFNGPLVPELVSAGVNVKIYDFGVLRKGDLKRKPLVTVCKIVKGFFYALNKMKSYDKVYINTIVNLNFILASAFYTKPCFVHVREMPAGFIMKAFKISLVASRARLIFNSKAVMKAFSLPGTVVYNGVNVSKCQKVYKQDRKRSVLFVGRLNDWKGADLLLKSIKKIEHTGLVGRVDVVGDYFGDQRQYLNELKELADEMQSVHINFVGFVYDTSKYFSDADICVVPSRKPEPFGRVVIEAMANALPVIVADHGGMSEIIEDNVTGYKFIPNCEDSLSSRIEYVLKNQNLAKVVSDAALAKYEECFTETAYQKNISDIIFDNA